MISTELAGRVVPIGAGADGASLVLPTWREADRKVGCPPGFTRVRPDLLPRERWGDAPDGSQMRVSALAFSVPMHDNWLNLDGDELPDDFERLRPEGEDLDGIKASLRAWLNRFLGRVQAILGQPLGLTDPVPGVFDRRGVEMLTWIEVDGRDSWLDEFAGQRKFSVTVVIPSAGTLLSERIVDPAGLAMLVDLADGRDDLPLPVELLGSARIAAQRQHLRQAISDLGTAAEAIIVRVAPQLAGTPLGGLITAAANPSINIDVPADTKAALVQPRNDAVHRAAAPTRQVVQRAAEIVDGLIRRYLPGFSPHPDTPVAARQPYQAHTLIAPPKRAP